MPWGRSRLRSAPPFRAVPRAREAPPYPVHPLFEYPHSLISLNVQVIRFYCFRIR